MNEYVSIIFLVFIVAIISAVVYNLTMNGVVIILLIGTIFTILLNNQSIDTTNTDDNNYRCENEEIVSYRSKTADDDDTDSKEHTYRNVKEAEHQFSDNDVDIKMYNAQPGSNIHYDMACSGDNSISDRMLEQGKRSKQSTDARAKFDKHSMNHYLNEELDSTANARWWDNEELEQDF